jgi:hypothetical protein
MRALFVATTLLYVAPATSGDNKSVFGTHWVEFQPIQMSGDLKGCQLVYMAVAPDHASSAGDWIAVNGSIILRDMDKGPKGILLVLKIGLKNLTAPTNPPFVRPNFAYLQTAHGSTAKAPQVPADGDNGYKLFTYRGAEDGVASVIGDIADTSSITIGYNRKDGGMDVLVPLDLTVVQSDYNDAQEVIRKTSPEVLDKWAQCVTKVLSHALGKK